MVLAGVPALLAQSQVRPFGAGFKIAVGVGLGGSPAVAYDGESFLVTWTGPAAEIQAARVTAEGSVLDPVPLTLGATTGGAASVAFDGLHYLVVWVNGEILARRVKPDGSLPDATAIQVTTGAGPKARAIPIGFDGTHFLVAWRTLSDEIYAARVAMDGTIVDGPAGFRLGSGFYPSMAFDGFNYLVVWHAWGNSLDVLGNRVSTAGTVLDGTGFVISGADERQEHPSVAFDGSNYLVVWSDERGGLPDYYSDDTARGARVSPAAAVLDAPSLVIGEHHRGPEHVTVGFDGGNFLVLWMPDNSQKTRGADVFGRRVSEDGAVIDAQGIPVATSQGHQWGPRFGCGGDRCLVAWGDLAYSCGGCIWGQMLEQVGTSPGTRVEPSTACDSGAPEPAEPKNSSVSGWASVPSPTSEYLNDVLGLAANDVYAVGEEGFLFHYDGSTWSSLSWVPNGRKYALWAGGPGDVAMEGNCWDLVQWDGLQATHSDCHPNFPVGRYAISLGLARTGPGGFLTVGLDGQSLLWEEGTDLGDAPEVPTGVTFDLWDMWQSGAGPIYTVGERGTVLVDDGVGWSPAQPVPTVQSLNAVWGRAPDDVYAVGDFGTILHYDGAVWSLQESGTLEHLLGLGGSSSMVYAVGAGGTILRSNGRSWQPEDSGTEQVLMAASMGGEALWVVGNAGTILTRTVPTFADGFESGDTSAWSGTTP